jgi:hypothetical protein
MKTKVFANPVAYATVAILFLVFLLMEALLRTS